MKFSEILLLLAGVVAVIWVVIALNTFIGGNPIFAYVGTPVAIGGMVIVVGLLVVTVIQGYLDL